MLGFSGLKAPVGQIDGGPGERKCHSKLLDDRAHQAEITEL